MFEHLVLSILIRNLSHPWLAFAPRKIKVARQSARCKQQNATRPAATVSIFEILDRMLSLSVEPHWMCIHAVRNPRLST